MSDKEIFLSWLVEKNLPQHELDVNLANQNNLKFDNHADNADNKQFITEEKLESSFKLVYRSSY